MTGRPVVAIISRSFGLRRSVTVGGDAAPALDAVQAAGGRAVQQGGVARAGHANRDGLGGVLVAELVGEGEGDEALETRLVHLGGNRVVGKLDLEDLLLLVL